MIAIEINGAIKLFNEIPNRWNNTEGYNYDDPSIHYIDGFRSVVEPSYNTSLSYKGSMYYDTVNNVFTYYIIDYTEAQLASILFSEEERQDKDALETLEKKGLELYERTKNRLIRRNKKGLLTKLRAKKVRSLLHPIFLMLKNGEIDLANDEALLILTQTNVDVEFEIEWFRTELADLLLNVNNLL